MRTVIGSQLRPLRPLLRERLGRDISPATTHRWMTKGVRGVRLQAVRVGKCLYADDAAVSAFIAAQQDGSPGDIPAVSNRSPETEAALRSAGLLPR